MKLGLLFLLALGAGWLITRLVMTQAPKWGLMDHPGGRKAHVAPVPLVGGFGMFLTCVAMIPFTDIPGATALGWFCASLLLFGIGLMDDVRDLSAYPKFAIQISAALVMALGAGLHLTELGNLLGTGTVVLGAAAIPFTVFAVVGVMNAVNMSDGVDGLAGGIGFIAVVWFSIAAALVGNIGLLEKLAIFGGAVGAFLLFNLRTPWRARAAVFMGDSGSLFLGFMLAWLAVRLAEGAGAAMPAMTAVWILALPITDTLASMLRRMARGRSPFSADREHVHHILMAAGYTDRQAVSVLLFASLLCGAFGIGAWQIGVPDYVMFYAWAGLFAVHFFAMMHAWRLVRLISRGSHQHAVRSPAPGRRLWRGSALAGGAQAGPAARVRPGRRLVLEEQRRDEKVA